MIIANDCIGFSFHFVMLLPNNPYLIMMCQISENSDRRTNWDTASEFTDMDKERTPYELTLGWNVKVDREDDFAGKEALIKLKAQGPRFRMKGFTINNDCSVEDGQPLYADINGERTVIGTLPSVIWKAEAE